MNIKIKINYLSYYLSFSHDTLKGLLQVRCEFPFQCCRLLCDVRLYTCLCHLPASPSVAPHIIFPPANCCCSPRLLKKMSLFNSFLDVKFFFFSNELISETFQILPVVLFASLLLCFQIVLLQCLRKRIIASCAPSFPQSFFFFFFFSTVALHESESTVVPSSKGPGPFSFAAESEDNNYGPEIHNLFYLSI